MSEMRVDRYVIFVLLVIYEKSKNIHNSVSPKCFIYLCFDLN